MKKYILIIIIAAFSAACGQENKFGESMNNIRKPAVAGMFYPGDKRTLEKEINSYINEAETEEISGNIFGIVAPHAGYVYSGPVAGYAYKLIKGKKYETVVVISPSHQEFFRGCSVFDGDAYETPLGQIKVDKETAKSIANKVENIYLSSKGHHIKGMGEHSLEVQLPFLQVALGKFEVVPIVIGDQSEENCSALGMVLAEALKDKNALIVASSDLSHYHSYDEARKIDSRAVDCFEKGDLKGILDCEACGSGPI